MAVRIRFKRMGRKNRPFYRVAVFDARTRRDGRCIENLGYYNPMEADDAKRFIVDRDRVKHWLDHGAKPSENVAVWLKKAEVAV